MGLDLAHMAKEEGIDAVGVGEMGIGNTSTSAAVLSALTGASGRRWHRPGRRPDGSGLRHEKSGCCGRPWPCIAPTPPTRWGYWLPWAGWIWPL